MKKSVIVGIIIFFIGIILQIFTLSVMDFDIKSLIGGNMAETRREINEDFDNIVVIGGGLDIRIFPSDNGKCSVTTYSNDKLCYDISVANNTLTITEKDNRKWHDYIVSADRVSVNVFLPKETYESITLSTKSGDITLSNRLTFNKLITESHSGDIRIYSQVVEVLSVETRSGDAEINWNDTKSVTIKSHSGDVEVIGYGGREVLIETQSGDVEGNISGDIRIYAETRSGEAELPHHYNNGTGSCIIRTNSGDIELD